MVKIPRRQILTEKMEGYKSNAGNDLKLAGQALQGTAKAIKHTVDRAKPFATAVRGTPQDNRAANFIRDITGINNKFAMVDLEGDAKMQATKINTDLQKKYADNPTDPNFAKELESSIAAVFDKEASGVPLSENLKWAQTKQQTINQFKQANLQWAEKQSLSNLERRVKDLNTEANNRANFYGESDCLNEFLADSANARDLLGQMADDFKMSPEQKSAMLSAFDTQQVFNYLKGLASTNPEKARQIVENDRALALMIGKEGRADLARAYKAAKTTKTDDQKIKDIDLNIPRNWDQAKIDALNQRTDELISRGHSIAEARRAAIREFKEADKDYQESLVAALDMPQNWGDITRNAAIAYADRLIEMGLDRPTAIKQAVKEFKGKESELSAARDAELKAIEELGGEPSERLKELESALSMFGASSETPDYAAMSDAELEELSAKEQQELLIKDLEKHIVKGEQTRAMEAKQAAKQRMYDEMNAFISNPSDLAIAERKAQPEYYLDTNYKKLTDAMEKWYAANNTVSEATESSDVAQVFDSLGILTQMQADNAETTDMFVAYYNDLAKIQNSGKFVQADIDNYAAAARQVVNSKTFAKNYDYLINKARDYFPAKNTTLGSTGSGFTAASLKDRYKKVQAEAFAMATYQMLKDNGDPTNAVNLYVSVQDELYKSMLLRAGIDLDQLELKRQNNERAIFILNGIPQEYLGRDDQGVILSEAAWDTIQIPQNVGSNAERDAEIRDYEKLRKRGWSPSLTQIEHNRITSKYPNAKIGSEI